MRSSKIGLIVFGLLFGLVACAAQRTNLAAAGYLSVVVKSEDSLLDEPLVESHGASTMVSGRVIAAADRSSSTGGSSSPIHGYVNVRVVRPDGSIWRQGRAEYASIPVGPGPRKLATYSIMLEGTPPRGSTVLIDHLVESSNRIP